MKNKTIINKYTKIKYLAVFTQKTNNNTSIKIAKREM